MDGRTDVQVPEMIYKEYSEYLRHRCWCERCDGRRTRKPAGTWNSESTGAPCQSLQWLRVGADAQAGERRLDMCRRKKGQREQLADVPMCPLPLPVRGDQPYSWTWRQTPASSETHPEKLTHGRTDPHLHLMWYFSYVVPFLSKFTLCGVTISYSPTWLYVVFFLCGTFCLEIDLKCHKTMLRSTLL